MKKILFTSAGIIAVSLGGLALANTSIPQEQQRPTPEFIKAVEANDFAAFQTAAKDSPMSVVDTQEKFTKLVEAEKTIKSAHENMQKVRTELGIKEPIQKNKRK